MIREKKIVKIQISFFVKACDEQLNTVVEANLDPNDEVNYALIENNIPNNGFINKKTTDRENIHNKLSRSSSITSEGILLLNDKNDSTIIEFGNAVRSGSIDAMAQIIENNGTSIISRKEIKIEVSFRLLRSSRNNLRYRTKPDLMWMSPFHLAIIARQSEVVQFMLESLVANDILSSEKELRNLLSQTTDVKFSNGTPEDYFHR